MCALFVRFGVKEEYMLFMNEFVEREIKNMKEFISKISVSLSAYNTCTVLHCMSYMYMCNGGFLICYPLTMSFVYRYLSYAV